MKGHSVVAVIPLLMLSALVASCRPIPGGGGTPTLLRASCDVSAGRVCIRRAEEGYTRCMDDCCNQYPSDPSCATPRGGQDGYCHKLVCGLVKSDDTRKCYDDYLCGTGSVTCSPFPGSSKGLCCIGPNEIACDPASQLCADKTSDTTCGGCKVDCTSVVGQHCVSGGCLCTEACPGNKTRDPGACTCHCSNSCPGIGQNQETCHCLPDRCSRASGGWTDFQTDVHNCGSCGNECSVQGRDYCYDGNCRQCGQDELFCPEPNGKCVKIATLQDQNTQYCSVRDSKPCVGDGGVTCDETPGGSWCAYNHVYDCYQCLPCKEQ